MRRWRQKQIDRMRIAIRLKPPMPRMYFGITDEMRKHWNAAEKMFGSYADASIPTSDTKPFDWSFLDSLKSKFPEPSIYPEVIVDASNYRKVKELLESNPDIVKPSNNITHIGIDISESDALDESTVVYGRKRPDGTLEILRIERLK